MGDRTRSITGTSTGIGEADRYERLGDLMGGFLAEVEAEAIDADRVADALEHALTAKRPKARYFVGIDAELQSAISRLLDRAREFDWARGCSSTSRTAATCWPADGAERPVLSN